MSLSNEQLRLLETITTMTPTNMKKDISPNKHSTTPHSMFPLAVGMHMHSTTSGTGLLTYAKQQQKKNK